MCGRLSVAVTATCVATGESGNNWQPAQISALGGSGEQLRSQRHQSDAASSGGCGEERRRYVNASS
ncbi:baseplate J/gp47 family protein [Salmonella enterica subsp. enterica]|nr:baseplate J/gp47 family protein [Salmonella enterica subsp. enterica]